MWWRCWRHGLSDSVLPAMRLLIYGDLIGWTTYGGDNGYPPRLSYFNSSRTPDTRRFVVCAIFLNTVSSKVLPSTAGVKFCTACDGNVLLTFPSVLSDRVLLDNVCPKAALSMGPWVKLITLVQVSLVRWRGDRTESVHTDGQWPCAGQQNRAQKDGILRGAASKFSISGAFPSNHPSYVTGFI